MSVYMNENGIHLYIESYQWMRDLGSWSLIQDTDTIVSNMIIWIVYTSYPTWYEGMYTMKANPVSNRLMIEDGIEYKNTSG